MDVYEASRRSRSTRERKDMIGESGENTSSVRLFHLKICLNTFPYGKYSFVLKKKKSYSFYLPFKFSVASLKTNNAGINILWKYLCIPIWLHLWNTFLQIKLLNQKNMPYKIFDILLICLEYVNRHILPLVVSLNLSLKWLAS